MLRRHLWTLVAFTTLAVITTNAFAKRRPPKPVAPVVADGVRYSADIAVVDGVHMPRGISDDGREHYVVATDVSTGSELWRAKVFRTHIKFWIEEDVQHVYMTNLKLVEDSLFVRDEKARCYSVDIKTHHVRKANCTVFTQNEIAEQ
jgi:hypothetical protein